MAEYIDREAAIDAVKQIIGDQDHECKAMMDFYCALRNIPAADVAPVVHGKLKYVEKKIRYCYCAICSVCGRCVEAWNFCSNCGAKMEMED